MLIVPVKDIVQFQIMKFLIILKLANQGLLVQLKLKILINKIKKQRNQFVYQHQKLLAINQDQIIVVKMLKTNVSMRHS